MTERYKIARLSELPAIACPCGETRRAFVDEPQGVPSIHVVDINIDAKTHYHTRRTEIYYILEATGEMELDG